MVDDLILVNPELRLGITENRRYTESCDIITTVRCLFRFAQERYYGQVNYLRSVRERI